MNKYEWRLQANNSSMVEGQAMNTVARAEGTSEAVSFVEAHNAVVRELTERVDGLRKACLAAHGCFSGKPEWWDLQADRGVTSNEVRSEQIAFLADAIAKAQVED